MRQRAAEEMIRTGFVAKQLEFVVANGFTGSGIWHLNYSSPAVPKQTIEQGYQDFVNRWLAIQNAYQFF